MKRDHDHYGMPAPTPSPRAADPDLFSWAAPSVRSEASEAAADALETPKGRGKRERDNLTLLRLIASRERGYTRQELADTSGIPLQTVCARVKWDLEGRGFIDTASTIKREGRTVLFATGKGHDFLATLRAA